MAGGIHSSLNGNASGPHLHHHHHHGAGGNGSGGGAFGGLGVGGTVLRLPDVELATLRELPRIGHHMLHHNQLYAHGPLSDADIDLLPQIRRDHITIEKLLGSGQFGDVYQGKVRQQAQSQSDENVLESSAWTDQMTRVAIKTLKKGASQHDKEDFLKEALVMNNFKHRHITQLIGVCFYDDELYIVMELMQGGDLLEFLRESRGTTVSLQIGMFFINIDEHFFKSDVTTLLHLNSPHAGQTGRSYVARFGRHVRRHRGRLRLFGGEALRSS